MKINQFNQNVFETRIICFLFVFPFVFLKIVLHQTTCTPSRSGVYRIGIHALKAQDKKTIPFQYSGKGGGLAIKGKRTAIMRSPFGKWQYTEIFSEKSSLCTQSSRGGGGVEANYILLTFLG